MCFLLQSESIPRGCCHGDEEVVETGGVSTREAETRQPGQVPLPEGDRSP